jgi:translocation and assembly module TamA
VTFKPAVSSALSPLRRCCIAAWLAIAVVTLLPGAAAWAAEGVAYETTVEGVPEDGLRRLLEKTSQLIALESDPPLTPAGLERRARDDRERLRRALRSEGFYAGKVAIRVDTDPSPAQVTIKVESGPVYLLAEADVVYTAEIPAEARPPRDITDLDGLETGMAARAPRIIAAQNQILTRLGQTGFPNPRIAKREAVVDHDTRTLRVTWRVDPGPYVDFGVLRVRGLDRVETGYVRAFRAWTPGQTYDERKVAETRRALMATNLFAGIEVTRPAPEQGRQPIVFTFTEREQRSVGVAGRFSTAEGPSASAFWEHRNAFGRDENVRATLDLGLINQEIAGIFSKPRFWQADQTLNSELRLKRQSTEAFSERTLASTAELDRQLTEIWSAALGGSLEATVTDDNKGERTFILAGAPGRVERDSRDDPLNPTEGSRLRLLATPYAVTLDETEAFLRSELHGAGYLAVDTDDRLVLAARGRVGSLIGPPTSDIPASKRFYAGGGGSLRGFDFQSVGPLDLSNDPLGGRSVIEASVEARWRVVESIGIVPFLDAGNVFDTPIPGKRSDNDARLRLAAGLGLRYFTPIGPLRLDVARAIDRRKVDAPFELYISFGQAF